MIRVLHLIDSMACGGTQTHVANMVRGHDASRFSPSVLCLQEKGALGERLEGEGWPVVSLGLRRIYGVSAARSYPRYVRFLVRERIDVVHAYLFAGQAYGVPGARLAGVPLVIAGRRSVGVYWRAARYRAVRAATNRLAHLHVANAEAVREFVVREEGVPPEKVRVVYNGVDTARFRPGPGGGGEEVVAGYVGSLTRVKGVDVLIRALPLALAREPRLRVVLHGAGPGEARRRYEGSTDERLRALVRDLGVEGRVTFAGPTDRPEEAMRRMDLFVMPSVAEGMSNAVLEAMASGLPVIASDGGGNREVVEEGANGLLFPSGDERLLADRMAALARDREGRLAMGREGRRRALERFTIGGMVARMERLYEDELARRGR
ncbi:MAG: glycosyltransferase [bacterium]|nr:glycosyltransferase [bacterium]